MSQLGQTRSFSVLIVPCLMVRFGANSRHSSIVRSTPDPDITDIRCECTCDRAAGKAANLARQRCAECAPYAAPINIPTANTSEPPSTTWKAARRNGVSM